MKQKITIVICTHNRSGLLSNVIGSLNQAKHPETLDFSLLVIPNACSDDTVQVLRDYSEHRDSSDLPLVFEEEPVAGKSHALNRAIGLVTEGFLCFVDDDHRVDNLFLCAIEKAIQDYPEIKAFCGQIIPDWTGNEPSWIHDQGEYKIFPLPVPHYEMGPEPTSVTLQTRLPGGGNLTVHKDIFDVVGGFSTELGPKGHNLAGSEDSDFVKRTLNAGFAIQYVPDIVQYHYVDDARLNFNYLLRKSFQRNRTLTQVKYRHSMPVPRYLWRKLIENSLRFVLAFSMKKYRFYAMRVASSVGEIVGYVQRG